MHQKNLLYKIAFLCIIGTPALFGQVYEATLGLPLQLGQFRDAKGIAVDPTGNIFIGDAETNTITKFDPSGNPLIQFGSPGIANGQFNFPSAPTSGTNYFIGFAINAAGELFIPDFGNNRIQKFSNAGVFISSLGSVGSANGQFFQPSAVALDANGNIFVSERGNHRVQKFSSTGTFLAKWGDSGTSIGKFGEYGGASGIAIDAQGSVYVADGSNGRIQKFDNNGVFISEFGSTGSGNGQFNSDYGYLGVALDGLGNIFVSDPIQSKIQKFDIFGAFLLAWGSEGNANGEFYHPLGLAIDANNNLLVVDGYSFCAPCFDNNRIQKFTNTGTFISKFGGRVSLDGQLSYPHGVATDHLGNVYVTDSNNHRIQKFNPSGAFVGKWGSFGAGATEFFYPLGIAIDKAKRIYVVDSWNFRVKKFNSDGNLNRQFGSYGYVGDASGGDGKLFYPEGIAIDKNANVYIADTGNDQIQIFDSTGVFITRWGKHGADPGNFEFPKSIAIDDNGFVYVTDLTRIQKFTPNGVFVASWVSTPGPVIATSSGDIMTIESETGLAKIFTSTGTLINSWGGFGSGNLQFNQPQGITIFENRYLYIADSRNHRVLKLSPTIAFAALNPKTYGDAPYSINSTSTFGAGVTYTSSDPAVATVAGTLITLHNAGSAIITAKDSYETTAPVIQTLIVNKADLTVTADSKSKIVGDPNPPLTITYSGFKNTDIENVLDTAPVATTAATSGSPAGNYQITVSGGSDNNYLLTYVNGTLTIEGLITSVHESYKPISVNLYPNPAIQEVKITLNNVVENQISKLTFYDLFGKTIIQQEFSGGEGSLQIDQYPSGCYVLSIATGKTKVTLKLIKE